MNYQKYEEERQELALILRKRRKKGTIIGTLSVLAFFAAIALIVVYFTNNKLFPEVLFPLFIVFAVCSLVGVVIGMHFRNTDRVSLRFAELKKNFFKEFLDEFYPNIKYEVDKGIRIDKILESGMLSYPDYYQMEDYFEGIHNNVYYRTCDVVLQETVQTYDDGKYETEIKSYFVGRCYIFKLEKPMQCAIKIGRGITDVRGLVECEVESIFLTEHYSIFSSDEKLLFYYLTPPIIEKMIELEKEYRYGVSFAFLGDEVYVYVNDNSDFFKISHNIEIDEALIEHYKRQFDVPKRIIEMFDLDGEKYRK